MSKLKKGFYWVEYNNQTTIAELTDKGWLVVGSNKPVSDNYVETLLPIMDISKMLERYKFLNTKLNTLKNKKQTMRPSEFIAKGLPLDLQDLASRFAELKHITGLPVKEEIIKAI